MSKTSYALLAIMAAALLYMGAARVYPVVFLSKCARVAGGSAGRARQLPGGL